MTTASSYRNGRLETTQVEVVREFPLRIVVNRREIATLICSPHDLGTLAVGFLRQQGLVGCAEDILSLGVCEDAGIASVEIRGELPELQPRVITSSCGAGGAPLGGPAWDGGFPRGPGRRRHRPSDIFDRMEDLSRLAVGYRSHGGMHSSAVCNGSRVLLYAEDLGRHNTLDRIAGEALRKNIDLSGTMLVTSGRVPSETVVKAASLGIGLIASRTSPTDLAVSAAIDLGVTLVGYVRGNQFTAYTHPERVSIPAAGSRIAGITGVILAGGASRRMGSNKALLPHQGGRFIELVYRCLEEVFEELLIVTNTPEDYGFLPCRKVPDLLTGMGVLSGIHSALCHSATPRIFAVACDMPHLNPGLIRHLAQQSEGSDVLIPESDKGIEPLHAVYHKDCLLAIEDALLAGERKVVSFFGKVKVRFAGREDVARFDPEFRSFRNINTPEDYYRLRERGIQGMAGDSRVARPWNDSATKS